MVSKIQTAAIRQERESKMGSSNDVWNPVSERMCAPGTQGAKDATAYWSALLQMHSKKGEDYIRRWLAGKNGQAWRAVQLAKVAVAPAVQTVELKNAERPLQDIAVDAEKQRGVLVDTEHMHDTQRWRFNTAVKAQAERAMADVRELKSLTYGDIEPEVVLARVTAAERSLAALKGLVFQAACVVLCVGLLAGCCEGGGARQESAPTVESHSCANGQCRLNQ